MTILNWLSLLTRFGRTSPERQREPVTLDRDTASNFDHLLSRAVLREISIAVWTAGPASGGMSIQANGLLSAIPLYLPVPAEMIWVLQTIFGCDLSMSRVSKIEKILSPSLSVNTQTPPMLFSSPDATSSAPQCPAMGSSEAALPRSAVSVL